MEGKGATGKQNRRRERCPRHCARGNVTTKLQRIAELARKDRSRVFTSVAHAIDLEWVGEAYRRTRKDGAAGVDGCTWADYAANLEANLSALATKIRAGTYRPPPVRRAYIPKTSGGERPIGIPVLSGPQGRKRKVPPHAALRPERPTRSAKPDAAWPLQLLRHHRQRRRARALSS